MDKSELKCGDQVWCADGRRAEFIASTPHGIVVRLGFFRARGDDEPEEYYDDLNMVDRVFTEPPVEAIEARIAELTAKETDARASLANIRKEMLDAEREARDRMAALARHPPLNMLEALLEKRITHFAVKMTYRELADIETFEEATTYEENDYGCKKRHVRMLALVGTGNLLGWKINEYGDGSGNWKADVWPCLSYDDALKIVTDICLDTCAKLNDSKPKGQIDSRHFSVVENAKKYGITIPQQIIDAVDETRAEAARKNIQKAETELAVARARAEKAS